MFELRQRGLQSMNERLRRRTRKAKAPIPNPIAMAIAKRIKKRPLENAIGNKNSSQTSRLVFGDKIQIHVRVAISPTR